MEYRGLSPQEVQEMREDGFTETQIEKRSQRAVQKYDKKLDRFTLRKLDETGPAQELRLVLLGKTGAGKSSTGNLILGENRFHESSGSTSYTEQIQEESVDFEGVRVRIIDTPGFFDTSYGADHILTEIAKVLDNFSDGVHGFVFVYSLGNPRFTQEEKDAFEYMEKAFGGESFFDHCFIALTHGDSLGEDQSVIDKIHQERGTPFGELLSGSVKSKLIAVDNKDPNAYFRGELRKQVIRLITQNVARPYTNVTFEEFLRNKGQVASQIQEPVRHLASSIEDRVSTQLEKMPNERIRDLSDMEKQRIVEEVHRRMREDEGANVPQDQLREAIPVILAAKKERLTSKTFLEKVKDFAVPLLKAAGFAVLTLLKSRFPFLKMV